MRISDWSSDVCSSDLAVLLLDLRLFRNELPPDHVGDRRVGAPDQEAERVVPYLGDRARIDGEGGGNRFGGKGEEGGDIARFERPASQLDDRRLLLHAAGERLLGPLAVADVRSEEHTSELQSLMRISYAVFCLKKKKYEH